MKETKTAWVKNARTGMVWEVAEERAGDLLRESDDEGLVYERTDAPTPPVPEGEKAKPEADKAAVEKAAAEKAAGDKAAGK